MSRAITEKAGAADSIHDLDASAILARLRAGTLTSKAVVEACLDRINSVDSPIRAWASVNPTAARRAAERLDAVPVTGLLHGVPIGVKDVFSTYDLPTQMGSAIWSGFTPGNDARVVSDARLEGAVVLGKTVTAEFAVHTPGETRNPYDPSRSPGTSSSGSAAAVAAGMVPVAIGTQTAGSIIRPASYCGIYGFKPSFGLVPRTGCLKTADTLDTVGWFSRSVRDLRLLFEALTVHGIDYPIASRVAHAAPLPGRLRIAVVKGPKSADAEVYASDALGEFSDRLRQAKGVEIVEKAPPEWLGDVHHLHDTIYEKALSYYFKGEFQEHRLVSPTMNAMIERGQRVTLENYKSALRRQAAFARQLDEWFSDVDAIVTLSTGGEGLDAEEPFDRPDTCLIWTLCGVPALSAPVFQGPSGLPFGLQLVARRHHDLRLLDLASRWCAEGLLSSAPYPPLALPQ